MGVLRLNVILKYDVSIKYHGKKLSQYVHLGILEFLFSYPTTEQET